MLVLLSIIGNINKGDGKSNSSVQTQTSVVTNATTTQLTTTEEVLIEQENIIIVAMWVFNIKSKKRFNYSFR